MTNGNKVRIAIPSVSPGGLNAVSSGHFGHCDQFTIINVEGQKIMDVDVIDNVSHVQGGCMVPVNLLAENGVQILLVNGIGMRPLMGFQQAGIKIYGGAVGTVEFVVNEFLQGNLSPVGENDVCNHTR
jgi:predicted Fe-Mo cluster-binding NifX family protein